MLLDDDVVGVLSVWRTEVDPFDDRAVALLTAFAAAAAIAVRNLDLVRALEARSAELALKVEQLEALGKVGEAVSSSLDLDMVLSTIVMHAVQLSGTDGGSLMEFDEAEQRFFVRTAYGTSDETLRTAAAGQDLAPRHVRRPRRDGGAAAAGRGPGRPEPGRPSAGALRRRLAVDGRRADAPRGSDRRRPRHAAADGPGDFPEETCDLLQTFASQSALAILNARLFRELERKTAELRGGQPPQVGVPRQHVARAAHPAQRGDRVLGGAARPHVRRDQRASAGVPPRHLELGQAPPPAPQRDPRPVQGRGREDGAARASRSPSARLSSTGSR